MIYIAQISLIVLFLALFFIRWFNSDTMKKNTKDLLIGLAGLTGISLLIWLLSKEDYRCPRCNYPVIKNMNYRCEHCGQPIQWKKK